ncbi:hypothetical protein [Amycolatopsis vancoresmycina]|uniref:Secreted protein n=1 Tax=Amycolatopsis vancoresmycina DSM 44592 TaxID=1292037 RepID=R1HZK3_9PSEU|nr:hypothetical protein [Amycolatopsis vancoresmycina]EOD63694.1 hypothetical protein H480_35733 [Amycolatopsis vancoresmycina DSM 44592]
MLKKVFAVTAALGAGAFLVGGVAAADTTDGYDHHYGDSDSLSQFSLLNLNNTDALHNVEGTVGVCDNNVNVLGVQVPLHDVANGIDVPILSGSSAAEGESPDNCAGSGQSDGGTTQGH